MSGHPQAQSPSDVLEASLIQSLIWDVASAVIGSLTRPEGDLKGFVTERAEAHGIDVPGNNELVAGVSHAMRSLVQSLALAEHQARQVPASKKEA
jgi:hypothetical protein